MKLLLTTLLLTLSISAEGLTGKWTGTFIDNSETSKTEPALVVLTQAGNTLTGTAGPNADEQMAISNGKVDGANITFDVKAGEVVVHFALKLEGKHLKGQAKAEAGGESHSATIDLTMAE